jgi:hypothetical protein
MIDEIQQSSKATKINLGLLLLKFTFSEKYDGQREFAKFILL